MILLQYYYLILRKYASISMVICWYCKELSLRTKKTTGTLQPSMYKLQTEEIQASLTYHHSNSQTTAYSIKHLYV